MKIIIKIEDGLVQAVYANGDAEVEILDMDVDWFENEEEEQKFNEVVKQTEETVKSDGWKQIY